MKKYIVSERRLTKPGYDKKDLQNRIAKREARIDEYRHKSQSYKKAIEEFSKVADDEFQKVIQPWYDRINSLGLGNLTARLNIDDWYEAGHCVRIYIGYRADTIGGGYDRGWRRDNFGWDYSFSISSTNDYKAENHKCGWDYIDMVDNDHIAILQYSADFIQFINNMDWKSFMYSVLQQCPDYKTIVDIQDPWSDSEYSDPTRDINFVLPELQKTIGKDVWIITSSFDIGVKKILDISDTSYKYVSISYYGDARDKNHTASTRLLAQIESGNFEDFHIYNSVDVNVEEKSIDYLLARINLGDYTIPLNLITQEELIENIQQLAAGN